MTKNVFIIGASGFIGSHIVSYLLLKGYRVRCAVRDTEAFRLKFHGVEVVQCDFNRAVSLIQWQQYLKDVDVVINAAGVLDTSSTNRIENVHMHGPQLMLQAAVQTKVTRIVHISALGIEAEYDTLYASTKKQFEEYCAEQSQIDWVILKPSLVYANNCYGGTSLLRGLATLPYVIPLIGDGDQIFQPIHMDDLVSIIEYCVSYKGTIRNTYPVVGPDSLPVREILVMLRNWMGLPKAPFLKIPKILIKALVKVGDYLGAGPLSSTSYKMIQHPNIGDGNPIINFTGINPRSFANGLNSTVTTIQSLWHARFYLIEPIIRIILGLFWIYTGVITLFFIPLQVIEQLSVVGIPAPISVWLVRSCSVIDILVGMAACSSIYARQSYMLQSLLVLTYTMALTYIIPTLWFDPLGSVSKNIPVLLLLGILLLLRKGR